jgi:hypothetical protein
LSPETCRADLKRPINGICCILLVAYINVMLRNILAGQRPQLDYILRLINFPQILSNLMGLCLTLNIPRGVLWGPQRVIFCDPAVTITTNLLLIFVCVPHQLKINIKQLDL